MKIKLTAEDRYDWAANIVLEHEGLFSDNTADKGGATNYGISLRFLKNQGIDINDDGQINLMDIKSLTAKKAKKIYKQYWWDKYNYEAINSIYIATKIFDMAVNMGAHQAHILTQRACNYCGYSLKEDGILGAKSVGVLNEICLYGRQQDLKYEIEDEQKWFYENLVKEQPTLKIFLQGWLKRAEW